ncbi:PRA1 family protein-domain-containing protein [Madurella fahalii]|uniref:PRA1 family protein-domain-containing protein n=1 Tax=Madurella fahalii TaxID=1157608 RepID=A0ABQ0FZ59_9PEZI
MRRATERRRGAGPVTNALGHRFISDPLRFTGVDLGERDGNTRSRRAYGYDDETSDESGQDSGGEGDQVRLPLLDPEEEALADAAMARIQRAQAKGKKDVKLSKEELAAYQRRLQRMQEQERRQRREERVAIPISQLDPISRKRHSLGGDSPPQPPSPELGEDRASGYPPMGYFPPPSSSRALPRSGTGSSRTPSRAATDREPSSSPFTYSYVRADQPPAARHHSDPSAGRPMGDSTADPFQFMTPGTRASYHAAGGSVRNSVLDVVDMYDNYGDASRRRSSGDPREGEISDRADAANGLPRGARVSSSGSASRGRPRDSIDGRPEPVPERRSTRDRTPPPPSKKTSSAQLPPVKRKSVSGTVKSSGRKKGK